jgi:hypothetical protein
LGLPLSMQPKMAARGVAVPHNDGAETESHLRSKRRRLAAMEYFAGLDGAMEETAICVIDREGKWSSKPRSPLIQMRSSGRSDPTCRNSGGSVTSRDHCRPDIRSRPSSSKSARLVAANSRHACATLVAGDALIAGLTDCMLRARAALWQEYIRLHKITIVARDELCRRFMRIPGVGPISALAVKAVIDDPRRFRRSKTVAAYLGLTARRWQSGSSLDVQGHISKAADGDVHHPLYEAANIMLIKFRGLSSLKAWGLKSAKKRGHKRACVVVARRLAVIMHAMWRDGSEFRFTAPKADRAVTVPPKLIGVAA